MAKINNTTAYPNVIPTSNDFVILTDVTDNDATKTAKVTDFQAFFGTKTISKTLSSAEILSCFTNPVTVIPATTGFYTVPISILFKLNFVTTQYTVAGQVFLSTGAATANHIAQYNALSSAASSAKLVGDTTNLSVSPAIPTDNEILFKATTANPTGGDGTLTIDIMYRLISI